MTSHIEAKKGLRETTLVHRRFAEDEGQIDYRVRIGFKSGLRNQGNKSNTMVNRVYGRRSERQRRKKLRTFTNEPDNPLVIEDDVDSIDNDTDEGNDNEVEENDQAAEERVDDEGDNNEEESNVGLQKQDKNNVK
ncbi:hypothetical protein L1887_35922 [Cichorium endivia]|nr:hypothetical protein L1887_35922 [Cichorium endivia]